MIMGCGWEESGVYGVQSSFEEVYFEIPTLPTANAKSFKMNQKNRQKKYCQWISVGFSKKFLQAF
jgi:hypothetical protein